MPTAMLATQTTVLRAIAEYGATRTITYHSRLTEARIRARTSNAAASLLPGQLPQV
ncbi:hypothetical protein [Actinoplanes sp. NPDC049265]|uniref:hypothetical protein n=1 Tax=Actinoplanes sp. NPDC049265 TaxID=3363902 RepID=UPI00371CC031